jgi:vanillate O-demethylase ferredoxin subunit
MSGMLLQKMVVVEARDETSRVRSFSLRHATRPALPAFTAGAHVAVETPSGLVRHYSLCSDPADLTRYRIAVLREEEGSGGSRSMHSVRAGDVIYVTRPRNYFELEHQDGTPLLLAAGIGITPILAMAIELERRGLAYELHYCARSRKEAAFADEVDQLARSGQVTFHFDGGVPGAGLDIAGLLHPTGVYSSLYACGPKPFLDAVVAGAAHWPQDRVRFERFSALPRETIGDGEPFEVELQSTAEVIPVPAGVSTLTALREAGVSISAQCEAGICGTCKVGVCSGTVIHRDAVLRPDERSSAMMVCVSRGDGRLVLAL